VKITGNFRNCCYSHYYICNILQCDALCAANSWTVCVMWPQKEWSVSIHGGVHRGHSTHYKTGEPTKRKTESLQGISLNMCLLLVCP